MPTVINTNREILDILNELYHRNQQFKENCRPIKRKYINFIEVNNECKLEYTDEEGYFDVRNFRRRYTPPGTKSNQHDSEQKIKNNYKSTIDSTLGKLSIAANISEMENKS